MLRLRKSAPKINLNGDLRFSEPMSEHTTFRVGGPADLFAVPANLTDLRTILGWSRANDVPIFVLGGGANVVVSDAGIRGVVVDMREFRTIAVTSRHERGAVLEAGAGMPVSEASAWAADHALGGLEFVYAMPGSVAGAVWMNARCYEAEVSDVIGHVDLLAPDGRLTRYLPSSKDFAYKRSPFQHNDAIMVSVGFTLHDADTGQLWQEMKDHERDRERKGHFAAPCAGSVFKNNRAFGMPTGAIIDRLGLRGRTVGGAKVSEQHANIIVNTGTATASDIRMLADQMAAEVRNRTGFELELEVLFVGDWGEG